jgi:hypothetical protein
MMQLHHFVSMVHPAVPESLNTIWAILSASKFNAVLQHGTVHANATRGVERTTPAGKTTYR